MPSTRLFLGTVLAAAAVTAQNLSGLPTCAETPALTALGSTGCELTDLTCICKDTSFLQSLEPAVQAACSPADLATALQFAVTLCEGVGVTLTIAPPSATSAPATTAPATTPPTTTVAVTTTVLATTTPAVTTSSSAVSSLSTMTSVTNVTVTPVVSQITDGQPQGPTATPSVTPFKGAAAGMAKGGLLAGVVAAVGVLAAL